MSTYSYADKKIISNSQSNRFYFFIFFLLRLVLKSVEALGAYGPSNNNNGDYDSNGGDEDD